MSEPIQTILEFTVGEHSSYSSAKLMETIFPATESKHGSADVETRHFYSRRWPAGAGDDEI